MKVHFFWYGSKDLKEDYWLSIKSFHLWCNETILHCYEDVNIPKGYEFVKLYDANSILTNDDAKIFMDKIYAPLTDRYRYLSDYYTIKALYELGGAFADIDMYQIAELRFDKEIEFLNESQMIVYQKQKVIFSNTLGNKYPGPGFVYSKKVNNPIMLELYKLMIPNITPTSLTIKEYLESNKLMGYITDFEKFNPPINKESIFYPGMENIMKKLLGQSQTLHFKATMNPKSVDQEFKKFVFSNLKRNNKLSLELFKEFENNIVKKFHSK